MKEIRFLSCALIQEIHFKQIEKYGGTPGIRDKNLLESAAAIPKSGMGNEYFHSDIFEMAASYAYHIINNHPFVDGNKRAGVELSVNQVIFLGLKIASSGITKKEIADVFRKNCFLSD